MPVLDPRDLRVQPGLPIVQTKAKARNSKHGYMNKGGSLSGPRGLHYLRWLRDRRLCIHRYL
jgi:hypothetical protein